MPPEQVYELMCAANELRPKGGIRAGCIRFLIGLLYTTGLRISEAIHLNLGQVDLKRGTLFIRRGKFGKDRLIALEPSTAAALEEWLDLRSAFASNGPAAALLVSALNKPLNRHQAERAFRRLCEQCGFQNNPRARLHDLRHNFACQCLAQWQREGEDILTLFPVLSTAMGHVNPRATQRYIHIDAATLLNASRKIHDRFIPSSEENQ
jgi:integrase/recombinase XerD